MAEPSGPDSTLPLPPAPGGATQTRDGKHSGLLALSVLLLVLGAGLAYASLTLRWGYYSGGALTASDLDSLGPAGRAGLTIWWGNTHNGCWCGPLPILWPALALLSALPVLVAAMRRHAVTRWWSRFGLLCTVCGFLNVLAIAEYIGFESGLSDTNMPFSADSRTVDIALSGYVLLALGILILTRATPSALVSRRSTPLVGGYCTR